MTTGNGGLHRLEAALSGWDSPWSLCVVGEDQSQKFSQMSSALREPYSETGDGKYISSGFSYWGVASTMAWVHACSDLFYPVMRESIESFAQRWRQVAGELDGVPRHYVSLGTGTGQKDQTILDRLLRSREPGALTYVPVDVSPEMLRLGQREALRHLDLPMGGVVPVQLDFANVRSVRELRRLVEHLVGDEPVLYSLLGNTLANFTDDTGLLTMLTGSLLRPQDRFLLEVARSATLDDDAAQEAAREYRSSPRFAEFVTSAIMEYTDLHIDMASVTYEPSVEDDRALKVKVVYRNRTGEQVLLTLPDRSGVEFPDGDTIRLLTTRKYSAAGLDKLLADAGAAEVTRTSSGLHSGFGETGFGMDLVLLRPVAEAADEAPAEVPAPNPFG